MHCDFEEETIICNIAHTFKIAEFYLEETPINNECFIEHIMGSINLREDSLFLLIQVKWNPAYPSPYEIEFNCLHFEFVDFPRLRHLQWRYIVHED